MRMLTFVGLDPGLSGGIVVLDSNRELVEAHTMPTIGNILDLDKLSTILRSISLNYRALCFLEQVNAMPGQGVSSMFKFGRCYGAVEGILAALGLPVYQVRPQAWQKIMHMGVEKTLKPKERSKLAFQRTFPGLELKATERSRVDHDGLIDALLIAEYGRRTQSTHKGAA